MKTQFTKLIKEFNYKGVSLNPIKITGDSRQEKLEKSDLDVSLLTSKLNIQEDDAVFIAHGDKDGAVSYYNQKVFMDVYQ